MTLTFQSLCSYSEKKFQHKVLNQESRYCIFNCCSNSCIIKGQLMSCLSNLTYYTDSIKLLSSELEFINKRWTHGNLGIYSPILYKSVNVYEQNRLWRKKVTAATGKQLRHPHQSSGVFCWEDLIWGFPHHGLVQTRGKCHQVFNSECSSLGCWFIRSAAAGDASSAFSWPPQVPLGYHSSEPESNKPLKLWVFPFPQSPT